MSTARQTRRRYGSVRDHAVPLWVKLSETNHTQTAVRSAAAIVDEATDDDIHSFNFRFRSFRHVTFAYARFVTSRRA
eukprot:2597553-Prymnesium_polylepis.1